MADVPLPEPVAQYDCVVSQVSAADRRALARAIGPERVSETILSSRIASYATTCAARFGWDSEKRYRAEAFGMAVIARDGLRRRLARVRIDPDVIDRWAELYGDRWETMEDEDAARLLSGLVRAGADPTRLERFNGEIGVYLTARETIADIRAGRPLN